MTSAYDNAPELKGLTLGQTTAYVDRYDAGLLMGVPRALNRSQLGLSDSSTLPFAGADLWTGYELSWLNSKGKPMVAILEASLPATSPNLVESKSFKLYLNSFNQTRFDSVQQVEQTLAKDLSTCAGGEVTVRVLLPQDFDQLQVGSLPGECIDGLDITVDNFTFNPDYLGSETADSSQPVTEQLHSHLLKSNCLITSQPDWGSVLISYRGGKLNREHLLRYLLSFRQHNEFHEQCVERIFCDIWQRCRPEYLSVYARYTRRGGLDINPWRSSDGLPPQHIRLARQ